GMRDVLVLRHIEPALQIKDRAGDGREARAVAARPALAPVLEPLQVLDPLVGIADRIRHQVVDRRAAGARRQLAGDRARLLCAAPRAAGPVEDAGAVSADPAGAPPPPGLSGPPGGVAAILWRGREAERTVMHR